MLKKFSKQDLQSMLRSQLIKLAGDLNIKGRSRFTKPQLVKIVSKKLNKSTAPKKTTGKKVTKKRRLTPGRKKTRRTSPQATELIGLSSVTPPPVPPQPQEDYVDRGTELPRHYGRDIIVGMVRDPNWVYVYWELEGGKKNQIAQQHGSDIFYHARWMLRLHNLTAAIVEDVPVLIESGNWYLNVPDCSEYYVEIGLLTADNSFICLAGSNRFITPRNDISPSTDQQWMIVEEDFQKLIELSGGHFERLIGSRPTSEAEPTMRAFRGMHSISMGSGSVRKK